MKAWLAGAVTVLLLASTGSAAPALNPVKIELKIPMDDGVSIAATLYLPDARLTTPPGGWSAAVFMHGLAGNRQQIDALVEGSFAGGSWVVLAFDARGHGESGGLVSIDGPREIADVREIYSWLAARPDVADDQIGAWGISYGGGAVLNSLVAGVPWAVVAVVETWTDLYSALAPQDLVKSGLVAGLAASIPEDRKSPELKAIQAAAFAGNKRAELLKWAKPRSSLDRLDSVRVPVFIAQGRRDFLFGMDQGIRAFQRLRGPKFLYLGLHGHAPSTFPAKDYALLLWRTRTWFDCVLQNPACAVPTASVEIVPENFSGNSDFGVRKSVALPQTTTSTFELLGSRTIRRSGRVVRTTGTLKRAIEVFGSPSLRVTVTPSRGWSRLVAVLTARTPQGKTIVVSAGGVPLSGNRGRDAVIHMLEQVTYIPKGSRLSVTLGSSSTAQSPSNLLYLDLPMSPRVKVRIGNGSLTLPSLRAPVTK